MRNDTAFAPSRQSAVFRILSNELAKRFVFAIKRKLSWPGSSQTQRSKEDQRSLHESYLDGRERGRESARHCIKRLGIRNAQLNLRMIGCEERSSNQRSRVLCE